MISSLFACTCCTAEPAEGGQVIYSSTDEAKTLPNLLPRHGASELVHKKVLTDPVPERVLESPLSDSTPLATEEATPTLSAPPPTVTQERITAVAVPATGATNEPDAQMPVAVPIQSGGNRSPAGFVEQNSPIPSVPEEASSPANGDDAAEMARLQAIVSDFSRRAARGSTCIHFNEQTGKRMNVVYQFSDDFSHFTVEAEKRGLFSKFSVNMPMARIKDVDTFEGCRGLLKPKALSTLTNAETERLLMIFYESKGDVCSCCLLEESEEARDRFQVGLKTLASSMRQKK